MIERNRERAGMALLCMQRYSWEHGTAMQAFLEAGREEIVTQMAKEAVYRGIGDGRIAIMGGAEAATDPCAAGEALLYAAGKTKDPFLKAGAAGLLQWALQGAPRSGGGIVYHVMGAPQFWVDSLYMLPPFLAAAGYAGEALKQIHGYWDRLYRPEKQMMGHMWDEGKMEWIRSDCWGVGNGWAMAGLARVIDLLPEEYDEEKNRLIGMVRGLIGAVSAWIGEDGTAHDVLDDPDTFQEVNLPQMFAYTVYRGMLSGWLDQTYQKLAESCLRAARDHMDQYGFIQGVCGAPHFDRAGLAPEGQAFYIMLEQAAERWRDAAGKERGH